MNHVNWPDPASVTWPEDANWWARCAEARTRGKDISERRRLWLKARAYTRQAIKLARTSRLRAQYAAWYRDYHYRLIWEV